MLDNAIVVDDASDNYPTPDDAAIDDPSIPDSPLLEREFYDTGTVETMLDPIVL